jgi:hypothetical protein
LEWLIFKISGLNCLREEGLFPGLSSGINIAGAVGMARDRGAGQTTATLLCDSGHHGESVNRNCRSGNFSGRRTVYGDFEILPEGFFSRLTRSVFSIRVTLESCTVIPTVPYFSEPMLLMTMLSQTQSSPDISGAFSVSLIEPYCAVVIKNAVVVVI